MDDAKVLKRKQKLLAWACKMPYGEVSNRINALLDVIKNSEDAEEVESSKFDATWLANILKKRTKSP